MNTENIYKTDRAQTELFLKTLAATDDISNVSFTFQVFDDQKPARPTTAKHFSGSLEQCWPELEKANQDGLGVFVMVNEGDGKGRSKANVKKIRALFVDLDGSPIEPILNSEAKPHIIIESSKHRYHAYWLVKDCELEAFSELQVALAEKFNGDTSVKDLSRVMRLAGFYHQKQEPYLSQILRVEPDLEPYIVDVLIQSLNLSVGDEPIGVEHDIDESELTEAVSAQEIKTMLNCITPNCDHDTWLRVGLAIHSQYPNDAGFNLYDDWSKLSSKYPGAKEVFKKWVSFNGRYQGKKITVATLFKLAKQNGYKPKTTKKKKSDKTYQDYIDFIYNTPIVQDIKREVLSDELIVLTEDGQKISAENLLKYFQSHATDHEGFTLADFERHLARHKLEDKKPELLIHIPEWDKQDRLKEICDVIRVKDFESEEVYELLLYWGSTIFRRLKNPTIQPTTIIFKGQQGVGKDTLVDALVGGLGDYQKELNLSHGKDAEAQLHTALVFRISEFDKSAKMNVAELKHLLTTSKTNCRLSYDRRAETRDVRASFIATCNIDDMLRDFTGNRRYWVLEIEYAGFRNISVNRNGKARFDSKPEKDYPGMFCRANFQEERLQILAQFKAMSEIGECKPSARTLSKMSKIISRLTPVDPLEEAIIMFDELINDALSKLTEDKFSDINRKEIKERGWVKNSEISELKIFEKICQATGLREKDIRGALKREGRDKRAGDGRGFAFKALESKPPEVKFQNGKLCQHRASIKEVCATFIHDDTNDSTHNEPVIEN